MMEPDFVADVRLATTDQGGRAGPILSSPFSCIMVLNGSNHDVRIRLDPPWALGERRQVGVYLLDPSTADKLHAGSTFVLREVRTIATGTVVEVPAKQAVA